MKVTRFDAPVGAAITGIDLANPVSPDNFIRIREAFLDASVLVFRRQDLTPKQLVAFSEQFGPSEPYGATIGEFLMRDHPQIIVLSNIVENGRNIGAADAGRYWHTDGSYVNKPAWFSMLYAREIPKSDDGRSLGDTRFSSMAAALEALPREDRALVEKLSACHKYVYRFSKRDDKLPGVTHPMVLTHPVTAQRGVYVNAGFTDHVVNVPEDEGKKLLARLYEHLEHEDFVYRHRWEVGDVVMWDNYITQHRATGDFGPDRRRLMWRTTIQGFDLQRPPRRDRVPEPSAIDQRNALEVTAKVAA